MSQPSGISPQELHDYVDGRLDEAERARVARYLATHPERAAEVESYRAQLAGLHGWSLRGAFRGDDAALSRFVAEAEQTYRLNAGSAIASDVAVQPAGALASIIGRRLGTAVNVPEFEQAGYRLVALRFVPT